MASWNKIFVTFTHSIDTTQGSEFVNKVDKTLDKSRESNPEKKDL